MRLPPPRAGGPPRPSKKITFTPYFLEIVVSASLGLINTQLAIK
jgi:hypothetical protein